MRTAFALLVGFVFLALAIYFLEFNKISGSEFVALIALGILTSIFVKYGDKIESFSLAGNAVNLISENRRAESNINQMAEISSAIAESLTISLPGIYDDHTELGYRNGVDFVHRYRLFNKLQTKSPFPHEKVELAVRHYLHDTSIGIRYRAMYGDMPDIPSPSQLLNNFPSDTQRSQLSESRYFKYYDSEIYPIFIESRARRQKEDN